MPFIDSKITTNVTPEKKEVIKAEFGRLMSVLGKSETYLMVGPFDTVEEAQNCFKYMQTRFFHLMVSFIKSTQNTMQKAYEAVPIQDFTQAWTDEKLYQKYGFSDEEIAYIESAIKPMIGESV